MRLLNALVLGFLGVQVSAEAQVVDGQEPAAPQVQVASADLTALSLDDLINLKVSTVSRTPERRWSAPSGLDVITSDDIRRAGAETLPDALRLATGVHVAQPSARSWAVSLRGMNVLAANKISVLMDGRSLFTPFFSGVQWDVQDTLLEDIDRIEVVRGPVGALWGAFAVNGFIQILTKPAWDTQGLLATAGTGSEQPGRFGFRYGGRLGRETYFRTYAKYFQTDWTYLPTGVHAQGATDFLQTGFRVDSRHSAKTTLTLQGDYYTNRGLPLDRLQSETWGGNVLGRWRHRLSEDSDVEVEGYFDHTYRLIPANFEERRSTGSASAKYHFASGRHKVLLGSDALVSADEIGNIGPAQLVPPRRTIHTLGAYAQDTVSLSSRFALVLGLKAEDGSFAGLEVQPTCRVAWTPNERTHGWAAVSRGVRTPVRIDEDLLFKFGEVTVFEANDDFKTETAIAYELGLRHRPLSSLTFDVSTFAYRYQNLRSTEPVGAARFPATFKNLLNARSYGAELAIMYKPTARVFLKGSYRILDLRFSADAGSRDTTRGSSEGNDPKHLAVVGVAFSLPANLELDTFLRLAGDLPRPGVGGYTTADARLAWRPRKELEISVLGRNLLERQYPEFVTTNSLNEEVHRSVAVKVTWRR